MIARHLSTYPFIHIALRRSIYLSTQSNQIYLYLPSYPPIHLISSPPGRAQSLEHIAWWLPWRHIGRSAAESVTLKWLRSTGPGEQDGVTQKLLGNQWDLISLPF